MKVLIGCEYSGVVREAFAKKGHDAWSCDLLPTQIPGQHIQGDLLQLLTDYWDLAIFHPPCTFLTITANRSFVNNPNRWQQRVNAMNFVYKLLTAPIKRIALENPVGAISTYIRKPDQYIQPYEFGHPDSKKTGLWLQNLPLLKPTNIVEPEWIIDKTRGKRYSKTHWNNSSTNRPDKALLRAKTYQGIADAMAEQWG